MNISRKSVSIKEAAEQVAVTATGWVGQLPGHTERIIRGQTFQSNEEGDLEQIEVFPMSISDTGKVIMTLHAFDPNTRSWGPVLSSSTVELTSSDCGRWISFRMPELHLEKGKYYGFKLSSRGACIGIGEAAGHEKQPPFNPGQEWEFSSDHDAGDCFSYFSLAYKVAIRA